MRKWFLSTNWWYTQAGKFQSLTHMEASWALSHYGQSPEKIKSSKLFSHAGNGLWYRFREFHLPDVNLLHQSLNLNWAAKIMSLTIFTSDDLHLVNIALKNIHGNMSNWTNLQKRPLVSVSEYLFGPCRLILTVCEQRDGNALLYYKSHLRRPWQGWLPLSGSWVGGIEPPSNFTSNDLTFKVDNLIFLKA